MDSPKCTCPESQWIGSEPNDSTCELSEEQHEGLHAMPDRHDAPMPPLDVTESDWTESERKFNQVSPSNRSRYSFLMSLWRERLCRERQLQQALNELEAMRIDRNLWRDAHNEDCPNIATANELAEAQSEIVLLRDQAAKNSSLNQIQDRLMESMSAQLAELRTARVSTRGTAYLRREKGL